RAMFVAWPLLRFHVVKMKEAGNLSVPGLSKVPLGSLRRAGPLPILIDGGATGQRRAKADIRAQTQTGGGVRAFARRFVANPCLQEHHAHSPTRRLGSRQVVFRTQTHIQTFPNESITKLFIYHPVTTLT